MDIILSIQEELGNLKLTVYIGFW